MSETYARLGAMRARLPLRLSAALIGAITLAIPAFAPGSAFAVAPTCNDMQVGVPHNSATPIFIDCTGGTGVGSPDVLVVSNPSKGTVSRPRAATEHRPVGDLHPESGTGREPTRSPIEASRRVAARAVPTRLAR